MKTLIKNFLNDEAGLSAVEYAVAGGLVILGLVAAFTGLGAAVAARINQLIAALA
jgi:pilus assembly protein Flp/PilA